MAKPMLNIRERLKSIVEQEKAPASSVRKEHPARLFFHTETTMPVTQSVRADRAGNRQVDKAIANSADATRQRPQSDALANSANAISLAPDNGPERSARVTKKPAVRSAKGKTKASDARRFRGKARPKPEGWLGLRPNDREVYYLLQSLCSQREAEIGNCTPPVGYKTISANTGISMRQAQICVQRLEVAGYLKRIGSDKTHPDLTQRGMKYEVALREDASTLSSALRATQNQFGKTDG